jgi:hypothetical protein
MMHAALETAGEIVDITSEPAWVSRILDEGSDGALQTPDVNSTVTVRIESERGAFPLAGLMVLTRGAWAGGGVLVMEDACGTGFDLRVTVATDRPVFIFRWRPSPRRRLERAALPSRFQLLARALLVQYPVLWWSSVRGRAPLHAIACTAGAAVPLLAGPGGVGKSTLLEAEMAAGASAASDNLSVSDGHTVWGLVEPMRIEGAQGRPMTHGRSERALEGRVAHLRPDRIVVVSRGAADSASLDLCDPATAARSLVTGTYMAGELRRFWPFAATLAAGTGCGPSHPPVLETARGLVARLPCYELRLPRRPGTRLTHILNPMEAIA